MLDEVLVRLRVQLADGLAAPMQADLGATTAAQTLRLLHANRGWWHEP
jgi:hypothetical protein